MIEVTGYYAGEKSGIIVESGGRSVNVTDGEVEEFMIALVRALTPGQRANLAWIMEMEVA